MTACSLPDDVVARLPSPQGVAFALTKACRNEHANLQEISDLVRTDPALSGRLLALANSAATGGRSVIAVDDAISRIGISGVCQVALAFSLIDQYSDGACSNFNYAGFWSQSLLMAAAAKELGTARRLGVASELFTLGLLAQIGCLAMATAFAKEYSELIVRDIDCAELVVQETHRLGTNHLALSEHLMTSWGIPAENVRPFCRYELPQPNASEMNSLQKGQARLANTAWLVALAIAQESAGAVHERPECLASLEWLGMDEESLNVHLREIESTWRFWLSLISRG
jgi:HD-like signal output (HDOD) protein